MLTSFIQFVAKVLLIPTLFVFSLAGYTLPLNDAPQQPVVQSPEGTYGAFNPTGGGTYYLSSTISSSQVTITLSSFKEPGSNIAYTMNYLNSSVEYGTIAPQTTQSEFISFTGITQNTDGSATLTGVARGLERSYPYAASSTLSTAHSGQTRFILSNPPQLTNQYLNLNNDQTVLGVNTFTIPPILTDANATSSLQAASRAFVTQTAFGTTPVQTDSGGTGLTNTTLPGGALLYYPSAGTMLAGTSSPTMGVVIATTTTATSTFRGSVNFASTTATIPFGNAVTINGTLTVGATSTLAKGLVLGTQTYYAPTSQVASSSVLQTDGAGHLSFNAIAGTLLTSFTNSGTSNTSSTTLGTLVIPPNTFTTPGQGLRVTSTWTNTNISNVCLISLRFGNGLATTSAFGGMILSTEAELDATMMATTSLAGEIFATRGSQVSQGSYDVSTANTSWAGNFMASTSLTSTSYLAFTSNLRSGSDTCTLVGYTAEVIK